MDLIAEIDKLESDSLDAIVEVIGAPKLYNDGKSAMRDWFLGRLRRMIPPVEPANALDRTGRRDGPVAGTANGPLVEFVAGREGFFFRTKACAQDGGDDLAPEATEACAEQTEIVIKALQAAAQEIDPRFVGHHENVSFAIRRLRNLTQSFRDACQSNDALRADKAKLEGLADDLAKAAKETIDADCPCRSCRRRRRRRRRIHPVQGGEQMRDAPERIGLIRDGLGNWALAHRTEADVAVHYARDGIVDRQLAEAQAEIERLRGQTKKQRHVIPKVYSRVAAVADDMCDEGDRVFLDTTNDAGVLRDLREEWDAHKIMGEEIITSEQEAQTYRKRTIAAEADRDALRAEVEALRRDAERYRWLRSHILDTIQRGGVFAGQTPQNVVMAEEDLGAVVDAALRSEADGDRP